MRNQDLATLDAQFWPDGFRRDIWMIVDGARDPGIVTLLRDCHMEHYCLYSGTLSAALAAAAPYLVQLDHNDPDTQRFLTHAWGNCWGVFLKCATHASALRRHLREFLVVSDPDGKRLIFRYYDPRVLRIYLPTCTPEELNRFFGPMECIWMEGDDASDGLQEYRADQKLPAR